MNAIPFDTLKFVERLEEGGFTHAQAKAAAEAFAEATSQELATKADIMSLRTDVRAEIASVRTDLCVEIASVRTDLRAEIAHVRTDLRAEIARVGIDVELAKRDLKIWFGSVMVVAVGVILAAIRYLSASH